MSIKKNPVEVDQRAADNKAPESRPSDIQQRLDKIITGLPLIAWESAGSPDSAGEQVNFFNDYVGFLLGYDAAEWLLIPDGCLTLIHPDDRERVRQLAVEKFALCENYSVEFRWIAKDGHSVWVESHISIKCDPQGQPVGFRGVTVDISKRKLLEKEYIQVAAELDSQKSRLQHIFDHAPSFIVVLRGPEMIFEMANPAYHRFVGERDLIGLTVKEALPELYDQVFSDLLSNVYQTGVPFTGNEIEVLLMRPDGSSREKHYVNFVYMPLREPDNSISGILMYGVDVTEQVSSRNRIEESEQRYHYLFRNNPLPMWVFDLETLAFLSVNQAAIDHYGYSEEEYPEMSILEIRPQDEIQKILKHLKSDYSGVNKPRIFRHQKKDGAIIDVEIRSSRILFNGRYAELVLANDVTERLKSESALRQAEENYRHLVESSPGIVYLNQPEPPYTPIYVSPNISEFGFTPEECYAVPDFWKNILHPEDRERAIGEFKHAVAQNQGSELKYRIIARDGSVHWWKDKARFVFDEEGHKIGWQGIILDITATKDLEEQLRQAQKLESVGLLAGGIAHDFNNMLTAINGYSNLTLRRLKDDDPLRKNLEEIKKAGERAADLTQQLLAFSRRQILLPALADLNEIITDTAKMLQRLIGEDIQLTATLNPKLGQVLADRGQFSQIIINLAVNARDSMPQGGTLTIETNNISFEDDYPQQLSDLLPGAYVMVAISDTGIGMNEEVKQHIFEPFYTTKEVGQGTGLGLATVYGIVKQSGGSIQVESAVGAGTTFKIYLPRVAAEIDKTEMKGLPSEIPGGTETILLVEDEKLVRDLSRALLEECGYTVIEAENGLEALKICRETNYQFDLLMTDVVMPQMSGRELAEKLSQKLPNLPVLFTSGYTDDAIVRHGVVELHTNFIQKPFTLEVLSNKLREIFDKKSGAV